MCSVARHLTAGLLDIELVEILEEDCLEVSGYLPDIFSGLPGFEFHLVFAHVLIGGQVADVGDIHHLAHFVAIIFESAPQDVRENIRSEVADVRVVVDRRPARKILTMPGSKGSKSSLRRVRVL